MARLFLDRVVHDPVSLVHTLSQKYILLPLLILVTTAGSFIVSCPLEGAILNNSPVTFPDHLSLQRVATDSLHEGTSKKQRHFTAQRSSSETNFEVTILRFKWVLPATLILLLLAIEIIIYFRRRPHVQTTAFQNLLNQEKKLHHNLQNSEEKFRRLFHTSPDSITLSKLDGSM